MQSLNYQEIDYEGILNYYSVQNVSWRGDELQFSCPFPEHVRGDRNPSSSINTTSGKWHCFSCGRSGNIITFVAEMEQASPAIAIRWIRETYGGKFKDSESLLTEFNNMLQTKDKPIEAGERVLPESFIHEFYVDWEKVYEAYSSKSSPKQLDYLFRRGFTVETLRNFEIGYDTRTNRITIPLRNASGGLVGFKGRSYKASETPRYCSIGDKEHQTYGFKTIKTSNYVWGVDSARKDSPAIIVEGEFDAMWLRQHGLNAISIGGSNPSEKQIRTIRNEFEAAILLLDPDQAGKKAEGILRKNLVYYVPVKIAKLINSDPADTEIHELNKILDESESTLIT